MKGGLPCVFDPPMKLRKPDHLDMPAVGPRRPRSRGTTMKAKLLATIALILMLLTTLARPADAKEPLVGEMDLQFNLGWPGPQDEVPTWVGTITIDEVDYGMAFFNIGTGKPFAEQPNPDSVLFAGEIWVIYDDLELVFDENGVLTTFTPGDVALSGLDTGNVRLSNSKYRLKGTVDEANGMFADWLGRRVHMSGDIDFYPFGAPRFAPGTLRLN